VTDILREWIDIAAALEVSEDTAQRYAARPFDPLPVYYDHAGRPCLRRDAVAAWIDRQSLFYHSYHALKAIGQLPGQRRARGESPRKRPPRAIAKRVRARS